MFAREFRWCPGSTIRFRLSRFSLIAIIVILFFFLLHCCEWYSRSRTHISFADTFSSSCRIFACAFDGLIIFHYFGPKMRDSHLDFFFIEFILVRWMRMFSDFRLSRLCFYHISTRQSAVWMTNDRVFFPLLLHIFLCIASGCKRSTSLHPKSILNNWIDSKSIVYGHRLVAVVAVSVCWIDFFWLNLIGFDSVSAIKGKIASENTWLINVNKRASFGFHIDGNREFGVFFFCVWCLCRNIFASNFTSRALCFVV